MIGRFSASWESVVTFRVNLVNALYFVAFRSFVAALLLRVVLITSVFASRKFLCRAYIGAPAPVWNSYVSRHSYQARRNPCSTSLCSPDSFFCACTLPTSGSPIGYDPCWGRP
jgi:hypothetical protein